MTTGLRSIGLMPTLFVSCCYAQLCLQFCELVATPFPDSQPRGIQPRPRQGEMGEMGSGREKLAKESFHLATSTLLPNSSMGNSPFLLLNEEREREGGRERGRSSGTNMNERKLRAETGSH